MNRSIASGCFSLVVGIFAATGASAAFAADPPYCDDPASATVQVCVDPQLRPASIDMNPGTYDPAIPLDITANGWADGIYHCVITPAGGVAVAAYASVNGSARTSAAVFVLAALDLTKDPYFGYGRGKLQNNQFVGTTSAGEPFALDISYADPDASRPSGALIITGSMNVDARSAIGAVTKSSIAVNCDSIF
jgi:hypothetical protein